MTRLSSEILEEQFGPTHVEVLYGGEDKVDRIIQTVTNIGEKILELSWVRFNDEGVRAYSEIHRQVVGGTSVGIAFQAAGVLFNPERPYGVKVSLPFIFNNCFGVSGPATVIPVKISVGSEQTHYCDIIETYSPCVDCAELVDSVQSLTPVSLSNRIQAFSDLLTNTTSLM